MNRRIIVMAACLAAMALGGSPAAAATVCQQKCDQAFQACNGSSPDTTKCLPPWGQCKRACTAPAKTTAAKTAAVVTPKAQVTKVAQTAAAKPTGGKAKPAPAGKAAAKPANGVGK